MQKILELIGLFHLTLFLLGMLDICDYKLTVTAHKQPVAGEPQPDKKVDTHD
ncbi:MAG: hypothetical protein GY938_31825 [Ketobacter sp.]|nr:hypothetical protein [Ketobacter sp.]